MGSTVTEWATDCSAVASPCDGGTWVNGGPDPDHAGFAHIAESAHFAIFSDEAISDSLASSALEQLEAIWELYFGSPMFMREPLCNSATKYKAAIHVHSDWGLTGGAWAADRMGMWIGTGGLSDHWGLAHEFMHGVQSVQGGMRCDSRNTCGWIYESHANWAAQQQAEYHTSEVHCSEMLFNAPHLYLGSTRDRYCNWQFLEYLKDKHCYSAVHAIWTGDPSPDPFLAIQTGMKWSLEQLNDFFGEWALHNVTWDYRDPRTGSGAGPTLGPLFRSKYGAITDKSQTARHLRLTQLEPLDDQVVDNRRFSVPSDWAPQRFGYNVVQLVPDVGASQVTVRFRGVQSGPNPGWRWGLVATDPQITTPRYSAVQPGTDGELTFCVGNEERLWLVVMATPSAFQSIVWDQPYATVPRYPYMIELSGAWPENFPGGQRAACPDGLEAAAQGGGCAPPGTRGYVGPYAMVLSGASVGESARIEDHAVVAVGNVSGGTVGALTLVGNDSGFSKSAFDISSGEARTTFYPLGFFENGQGLGGGKLIGDVEYRGSGLRRDGGTCSGFVDETTCTAPGVDETPRAPYAWRQ